jgi:hypothetical protein
MNIDLLPDDIETLHLSYQNLTVLPDLSRFKYLRKIHCSHNKLTSIDNIPNWVQIIHCSNNRITHINKLPFYLRGLFCSNNKITNICELPIFLERLFCQQNRLTCLPDLPDFCNMLLCYDNNLYSLPYLPYSLKILRCTDVPYLYYPESTFKAINIINNFRFNYYSLKYGHKLLFYLLKTRLKPYKRELLENSAKMLMNPARILRLLDNGIDVEYISNNL